VLPKAGSRALEMELLTTYEQKPEDCKEHVRDALMEAGLDRDQQVIDRAIELLTRAESFQPGVSGGLVGQINAAGGKVIVAHTIHGGIKM
jgi:hypothetical protein